MLANPPLGLYIHIPWCVRKCPYCDFNSHESQTAIPENDYITILLNDFDKDYGMCDNRNIQSIFIGGGTPSLFSAKGFERILDHLSKYGNLSSDIEITMEANPGTAEAEKFRDYRSVGINRLSLGIQSFNDNCLLSLGRVHNGEQARLAIGMAIEAGFENFNLDLMHGLPNQDQQKALEDLSIAISYKPRHLSWYQLTIEPNTVFYSQPPPLPEEDILREMQLAGEAILLENGFAQYEVSAFATTEYQSRHNLNYWKFGDYIGIGAGAHGKISSAAQNTVIRTRKHRQPNHYLQNTVDHTAEKKAVNEESRILEFMMNGLRLKDGFTIDEFEAYTGRAFSHVAKKVDSLVDTGLMTKTDRSITTTAKGYHFLNNVLEEFL